MYKLDRLNIIRDYQWFQKIKIQHEAQRQRAGMILFNWKHGTNLTYNPWLKFNSFVRPVNLERREQVIRAMVEKWVRQKVG